MDKRFAATLAALTTLAHIAVSWRYGYYRDELYFIACAKRLAWGYVDMPPLTALVAWMAAPAHYNLIVIRLSVAIAAGLTAYLACTIAAELGGNIFAQRLSGLTVALTPAYLFLGTTLTTTSYEPLTWALTIFAVIRLVRTHDARWWYLVAAAVTFGLYGKYSMLLLVAALLFGLLLTPERALLRTRAFLFATLTVVVLLLPNIFWQAAHGWPMLEVLRGDVLGRHAFNSGLQFEYRAPLINAAAFFAEQVLFTNPFVAPLWILGAMALFRSRDFQAERFIAIAFVAMLLVAAALNAKGYYIAGIYTPLICAGWVALERACAARPVWRSAAAATVLASGVALAPLTFPVLPPVGLIAYQPLFADEFGWDGLTLRVAEVYRDLPPAQRRRTAIFSDTYAGAAAIEFYGARYGLPQPISAQNSYYLWGTGGYDGGSMLAIGASQAEVLRANFRHVVLLTTFQDPHRWAIEGPTPIYLCTDPVAPLAQLWPRFKWYGA
mgnify:CR=1 FL=1